MSELAITEIRIPQLGEGLQEARIVRFLKQPGEAVGRDEPIYEMETDKAVMEIESPVAGVLDRWLAAEDDVLPIGAVVGRIASESPAPAVSELTTPSEEPSAASTSPAQEPLSRSLASVPPRTRAYAREKGLPDAVLAQLAARATGKLMPAAIDAYLAGELSTATPQATSSSATGFVDVPVASRQRTLSYHMQRSAQYVVPATMEMIVDWSSVEAARRTIEAAGGLAGSSLPSHFVLFAWCVARAVREHPRFRSSVSNESTLRQYDHLQLGIAVARPNDELLMARIDNADALGLAEFAADAAAAIERARAGEDQSSDVMQLSVTNLASAGVRFGIPVVVAPAVGTLFIGAPYDEAHPDGTGGVAFRRAASMVLTFDHRVANGVGAARFMDAICKLVQALPEELGAHAHGQG